MQALEFIANDAITRSIYHFRLKAKPQNIFFTYQLISEFITLVGEATHLEMIISHLLSNAADAVNKGEAEGALAPGQNKGVSLRSRCETQDNRQWLVIEVEDNGIGISQDILDRIYDPFFSTKEVHQEGGLGLSVCYGLARQFGGDIGCESPRDGCTVFRLRIPTSAQSGTDETEMVVRA